MGAARDSSPLLQQVMNAFVEFFAVYVDAGWRFHTQSHLLPPDAQHGQVYVPIDTNCFAYAASQNNHLRVLG